MRNIKDILAHLHYDPRWLEYEFIDQQFLLDQLSQYENSGDENTEHYRYASFCRLLDRPVIDDLMIQRFIELVLLDEEQAMTQSALAALVRHTGLTDQQLSHLRTHPAFASQILQDIIEETELLRKLGSSHISDDFFNRCLFSRKDSVQRKLLSLPGLSKEQLQDLSEYGVNRAIRNLAKEKLRRFRQS